AGDDTIIGSGGNDDLFGFAGNDTILARAGQDDLGGGRGKDRLTGGPGNDYFFFDSALVPANVDSIVDFAHAHDRIALNKAVFTKLNVSTTLNPAFFHVGAAAADANDYLVYYQADGHLYYDKDGSGPAHQLLIAVLANHAPMNSHDLFCYVS